MNAQVKERARRQGLSGEETLRWVAEQFAYVTFLWLYRRGGREIDPARGVITVPAVLLDFGQLLFLGAPMEVLVEVAFDWQKRLSGRVALVAGLLGGWAGYFPHRRNFEEPGAERLYKTVSTLFAPEAAEGFLELAERQAGRRPTLPGEQQ